LIGIEGRKKRGKIIHNVGYGYFHAMHQITAGKAIPFKAIDVAESPGTFYD
jgi:hypothetical protein